MNCLCSAVCFDFSTLGEACQNLVWNVLIKFPLKCPCFILFILFNNWQLFDAIISQAILQPKERLLSQANTGCKLWFMLFCNMLWMMPTFEMVNLLLMKESHYFKLFIFRLSKMSVWQEICFAVLTCTANPAVLVAGHQMVQWIHMNL